MYEWCRGGVLVVYGWCWSCVSVVQRWCCWCVVCFNSVVGGVGVMVAWVLWLCYGGAEVMMWWWC